MHGQQRKEHARHVQRRAERRRWWSLTALCLGLLSIAVNATIVNVALPSIGESLHFSAASFAWVINAYLATLGGFSLLGGRLGDLFGHRRLFLLGVMAFTCSSIGCGLAMSFEGLVASRAGQGLGGAIMSTVALSHVANLFPGAAERAKALGIYVFVTTVGSSVGVLFGGVLAGILSWRWVFLANGIVGVVVLGLCAALLPRDPAVRPGGAVDITGAVTATTSSMLGLYAIEGASQIGWMSARTLLLGVAAALLFAAFIGVEARVRAPLVPLKLFRIRNVAVANIAGVLFSSAALTSNFAATLYLQLVLRFSPLQVALVFLPANVGAAIMSLFFTPALAMRFGARSLLVAGTSLTGCGLILLARAPTSANVVAHVLPSMLLMGLGVGTAYGPLLLSALSGVGRSDTGVASGVANTSFRMGGAVGLAVVASVAAARTADLLATGAEPMLALQGGYQVAFAVGAGFALSAALISAVFLRRVGTLQGDSPSS